MRRVFLLTITDWSNAITVSSTQHTYIYINLQK